MTARPWTTLTSHRQRRSTERLALLALCLAAFAWRLSGLTFQSLWRDEVDSIRFATRDLPDLLATFAKPGENGPLFFLGLRPWLALAGTGDFALRFPSVLAGVLAVPLTYVLARWLLALWPGVPGTAHRLSLQNVPLLAALLVTVNPYLTWYGQEGKMYAWLVVLVLLIHLAFLGALRHGGWHWLLYLVMLGVSALTHVLAILVVPVHALWLLILWPRYRQRWLPFLATLLLPLVPYFLLAGWWQVRLLLNPDFQTGHTFLPLDRMASTLLVGYGQGVAATSSFWVITPIVFLTLLGVAASRWPGDRSDGEPGASGDNDTQPSGWRWPAMLLAWLMLPVLLVFLVSLSKPLYTDRYLIWVMPALALLVAQGVAVLGRLWRPAGWLALGLLVALGLGGGWRQSHTPIKSDFRSATAYVESRRQPDDRLIFLIPYIRYTYEHYAGPSGHAVDGLYTNSGSPPEQVDTEMRQAVGEAPVVWLVASEEATWDQRGLVRAWLDAHGQATDQAQFTRVQVTRYQLTPSVP
jgi:uncharacterized membrane protein